MLPQLVTGQHVEIIVDDDQRPATIDEGVHQVDELVDQPLGFLRSRAEHQRGLVRSGHPVKTVIARFATSTETSRKLFSHAPDFDVVQIRRRPTVPSAEL